MDERPAPTLAERIAAAQAWWREAGVDYAYVDEPQGWLAEPEADGPEPAPAPAAREAPAPASPPPAIGGDRANWPADLAAFREWWFAEPSLDTGGTFPRIPPRGEPGARLMMLVPMPEAEDRDGLLAGPQGRLLASFALAMGLEPAEVYWASALPRHMPLPDWPRLAERGLGEVLQHHVALVRPERLLVLGRSVSPLVGHDPAQASPAVSELTIQGTRVPLLATYSPERLLANARLCAGLWRHWLEWTEGDGP